MDRYAFLMVYSWKRADRAALQESRRQQIKVYTTKNTG